MKNFNNLIKNANKEIKRVTDFIQENEGMFESMNLKLYNANFKVEDSRLTDEQLWDCFINFCDDSFRNFTKFLGENNINTDIMNHIGSTSTFYLKSEHNLICQKMHRRLKDSETDFSATIYELVYNLYSSSTNIDDILDGDCIIQKNLLTDYIRINIQLNDIVESLKDDLQYITDSLYTDFLEEIEDMKIVYDYIKEFKDNQVEKFKEYIEWDIENGTYED